MLSNSSISIESFHHFDFSYFRVHFQTAKARKRWIHRSRWVCFHKTQKWIPSTHLKSLVRCFDKVFNIRLTFSNRWNWQLPLIFIILITLITLTNYIRYKQKVKTSTWGASIRNQKQNSFQPKLLCALNAFQNAGNFSFCIQWVKCFAFKSFCYWKHNTLFSQCFHKIFEHEFRPNPFQFQLLSNDMAQAFSQADGESFQNKTSSDNAGDLSEYVFDDIASQISPIICRSLSEALRKHES